MEKSGVVERPRIIILIDDPLHTQKIPFLEKILEVAGDYRFIEAVQIPPYGRNIGVPTNSDATPVKNHRSSLATLAQDRWLE